MTVHLENQTPGACEQVDADALAEVARGTAYVASLKAGPTHTVVTLAFPHGRNVEAVVRDVPAPDALAGLCRPLAVQVRGSEDGLTCSVLDQSASGPTRIDISMSQALALADSGIHTVFSTL